MPKRLQHYTAFEWLDRPIAFHRILVSVAGSIHAALMLGQAIYWMRRTDEEEGWFFKSMDEWEDETGLTRREQEGARKKLKKAKLIEERHERLKHRLWFRVNVEKLDSALASVIQIGHSPMAKSAIREAPKAPPPSGEKRHSSNVQGTTPETTAESTLFLFDSPEKLPPPLNTPEIEEWWATFQRNLGQKKKKLTPISRRLQIKKMMEWGPERSLAALKHSSTENYQGLFEPKDGKNGAAPRRVKKAITQENAL